MPIFAHYGRVRFLQIRENLCKFAKQLLLENQQGVMNREEAIAKGIKVCETKHSMKRRSPWHDYHKKGTYMLTLVVEGRKALLGSLRGNTEASYSSSDKPRVEYSELGSVIYNEEIKKIHQFYPMVDVWKVCIMPDHIHMIVRVKEDMPEGKHLGLVVAGFKGGCSKAAMRLVNQNGRSGKGGDAMVALPYGRVKVRPLFEPGLNVLS